MDNGLATNNSHNTHHKWAGDQIQFHWILSERKRWSSFWRNWGPWWRTLVFHVKSRWKHLFPRGCRRDCVGSPMCSTSTVPDTQWECKTHQVASSNAIISPDRSWPWTQNQPDKREWFILKGWKVPGKLHVTLVLCLLILLGTGWILRG